MSVLGSVHHGRGVEGASHRACTRRLGRRREEQGKVGGVGSGMGRPCFSLTYLFGTDGLLRNLAKLLDGLLVVPQILLAAHEDDGHVGAEVKDFRDPL